jgi:hypothetical protein
MIPPYIYRLIIYIIYIIFAYGASYIKLSLCYYSTLYADAEGADVQLLYYNIIIIKDLHLKINLILMCCNAHGRAHSFLWSLDSCHDQ